MARGKFLCYVCLQPESLCKCDKFCGLCYGLNNVRLCDDGVYYCKECREACDYAPES